MTATASPRTPLRHLSVRVPWHDTGWDGTFCRFPAGNASCLILKRIRDSRDDAFEIAHAGESWIELDRAQQPPCQAENAAFMYPHERMRMLRHPYVERSGAHKHLAETPVRIPPYAAASVPYRWMLRENAEALQAETGLDIAWELEERANELAGFRSAWVQDGRNQKLVLDTFYGSVQPRESLVFFYAKRTPLSENPGRVLIGAGTVAHVGDTVEFRTREPGPMPTMAWEHSVQHSIRPGSLQSGFLLPYHALLERAYQDDTLDPAAFVAFAPDDHFDEFSYGSELVTHEAAIGALLSCRASIQKAQGLVPGAWDDAVGWIDTQLHAVWQKRGPSPGFASALCAFGFEEGTVIAYELGKLLEENEDPWPIFERILDDPAQLELASAGRLSANLVKLYRQLPGERIALLKLLSRFDLSLDQARRIYQSSERHKAGIDLTDAELLANPYLLYECDRLHGDAITLPTVDRGIFPDPVVRDRHPLPAPSAVDDAVDMRRVRALTVSALESAAAEGDTLRSREQVIHAVQAAELSPACPVGEDLFQAFDAELSPAVQPVPLANGAPAYQLQRLQRTGDLIRNAVERRLSGKRHTVEIDWRAALDERLGALPADPVERELEERARQEKSHALDELAASRVSVLIGPAGTGKTLLLSVLCQVPSIKTGGVLLLAPTGKARVKMTQNTKMPAQTIAEFLIRHGGYDFHSGNYLLTTHAAVEAGRTIIIDEASMLTEEQIAATLKAVKEPDRLIFVGDPRQLPPIGSGRPFVDIVTRLRPAGIEGQFPRVGQGYTELTIRRRQIGDRRDDLTLAEWFSGEDPGPGADDIWDRIVRGERSEHVRTVKWETETDLQEVLLETIVQELGLAGRADELGFALTLGGTEFNGHPYFHVGRNGHPGAAAKVESWQILSPVRGRSYGTGELNRTIQRTFRQAMIASAQGKYRKIPKPMGIEEIVYGDKVIQTANQRRNRVYPEQEALRYVANGEIGIAVGQFKGKHAPYKGYPWALEIEFSSQQRYAYSYSGGDFGEEGSPPLELAYAITVHRAQGSEFGTTFLVLPKREFAYSREMLYTALTRQQRRIVLLHQGELADLKALADPSASETARRLTNLFRAPELVQFDQRFLEGNLIHTTARGEAVRSKSEVIVANALHAAGLDYDYERRFPGGDTSARYPDFTITDGATGLTVYWEHLGMLRNPGYALAWQDKLAWYRTQGVLPRDEGEGASGMLVTSADDAAGGIDSAAIAQTIREVFGR